MLVLLLFLLLLQLHPLHSQCLQANRLVCDLVCHQMCLCHSILICLTDLQLLLLCVVFIELLLLHISVLDRSHIPATNSLMSSDMLHVSLHAWSNSFQMCLISSSWLAGLWLCPMYVPCRSPGIP